MDEELVVEEGVQEPSVDTTPEPVHTESVSTPQPNELARITQLAEAAIQRERRVQAELDELKMRQAPSAPQGPTAEEFQEKPFETLKRLMETENAPLREYVQQQRRRADFDSTFNSYLASVPQLAPYGDTIRQQLSQTLLNSNTPINQSVIDVHTKALIGDMMLRNASFAQTPNPVAPSNNPVPVNPGVPKPPVRKADVQLTESDLRVKKQLDPDGKFWPTNQAFLDYLSQESREIPGV